MQLIYLFDAIKNGKNFVLNQSFVLNIILGVILFYLVFVLLTSIYKLFKSIYKTKTYISNLELVSKDSYCLFNSQSSFAFTAGFFKPRIYISSSNINLQKLEFDAIFYHEQFHQINLDPLKDLIIKFIQNNLSFIPFSSWFFAQYFLVCETSCDNFALGKIGDKKHLVSALYKTIYSFQDIAISQFSTQLERFKYLVNNQKILNKQYFLYFTSLFLFCFLSISFVSKSSLIETCQNLPHCINLLLNNNTKKSIIPCHLEQL